MDRQSEKGRPTPLDFLEEQISNELGFDPNELGKNVQIKKAKFTILDHLESPIQNHLEKPLDIDVIIIGSATILEDKPTVELKSGFKFSLQNRTPSRLQIGNSFSKLLHLDTTLPINMVPETLPNELLVEWDPEMLFDEIPFTQSPQDNVTLFDSRKDPDEQPLLIICLDENAYNEQNTGYLNIFVLENPPTGWQDAITPFEETNIMAAQIPGLEETTVANEVVAFNDEPADPEEVIEAEPSEETALYHLIQEECAQFPLHMGGRLRNDPEAKAARIGKRPVRISLYSVDVLSGKRDETVRLTISNISEYEIQLLENASDPNHLIEILQGDFWDDSPPVSLEIVIVPDFPGDHYIQAKVTKQGQSKSNYTSAFCKPKEVKALWESLEQPAKSEKTIIPTEREFTDETAYLRSLQDEQKGKRQKRKRRSQKQNVLTEKTAEEILDELNLDSEEPTPNPNHSPNRLSKFERKRQNKKRKARNKRGNKSRR